MHPLRSLGVLWLLPVALMLGENCVPRKSVPYRSNNALQFGEQGVSNYTTMLLREDLDLLVLGAREAVFALHLSNISNKQASVKWEVTPAQVKDCENKGKDRETECKNYIRILHKMKDGRMFVCGTNAFDPQCDYLQYKNGELTFNKTGEDGKGKCPFDPFQRYASIMVDDDLYSATSMNFLGSEPILMRSSPVYLRTEFQTSWLHEPNFVSMAWMHESEQSKEGDDDKVYLFFSETAVEFDSYNQLVVPRVARVCKGDLGGQRTLQKRWTSFLKTRIDCPVLNSKLPYVIQDSYLWCDFKLPWQNCIVFAVFTSQSESSDLSAVCAYSMSDISKVFSEGNYKTPVPVGTSFFKWVMYSGEVPVPRPGACINSEAHKLGITRSLELPDRTLQFVKDKPLMDQAVKPIEGEPLLIRRGATFTRIIVNQVQAADGQKYHIMFIATEEGTMLKAVNYNGEMFIIEEVQLFQPPQPIKIVTFSNVTGQIYAGSDSGAAQIPLASCERSSSCVDCVLARDPYCGWDTTDEKCVFLSSSQRELIQSVAEGDASLCPDADPVQPVSLSTLPGGELKLSCPSPSHLTNVRWEQNNNALTFSPRQQILSDALIILNATISDSGRYRCLFVERSKAGEFNTTVADYQVSIDPTDTGNEGLTSISQPLTVSSSIAGLQAAVALLVIGLTALLAWNFYKKHIPLPWKCWTAQNSSSNNNHTGGGGALSDSEGGNALANNQTYVPCMSDDSDS